MSFARASTAYPWMLCLPALAASEHPQTRCAMMKKIAKVHKCSHLQCVLARYRLTKNAAPQIPNQLHVQPAVNPEKDISEFYTGRATSYAWAVHSVMAG